MARSQPKKIKMNTIDCTAAFLDNLSQHFKDDSFSDVTLVVGNKRYPALKSILAVSSPFFQRMFYGGDWMERTNKDITLEETPECQEVFPTFLQYFYSGTVSVSRDSVVPLVTLADKYGVEVLKNQCSQFMMSLLNHADIEGALTWLTFAEHINIDNLAQKCFDIICINFEKATLFPAWSSLSLAHITEILQRSDMIVASEYTVYLAIQKWLLANTLNGSSEVLKHIHFKNMTTQELLEVEASDLASDSSLKTSDEIKAHTMEAFRYMCITKEGISTAKGCQTPAQRVYISQIHTKTAFCSDDPLFLRPICKWSSEILKLKWQLKKVHAGRYVVVLHSVPSTPQPSLQQGGFGFTFGSVGAANQSQASNPIPGGFGFGSPRPGDLQFLYETQPYPSQFQHLFGTPIHVKVLICFRDSGGVVHHVINHSVDTAIPQAMGSRVVELPPISNMLEAGDSERDVFHDILYSFEVLKRQGGTVSVMVVQLPKSRRDKLGS
ncbi:galectin-3-binding protein-like isoform X2 [Amphiura filiformis]